MPSSNIPEIYVIENLDICLTVNWVLQEKENQEHIFDERMHVDETVIYHFVFLFESMSSMYKMNHFVSCLMTHQEYKRHMILK